MPVWIIVWIVGQFYLATCQLIRSPFVWRGCIRPIAYKCWRMFSLILGLYHFIDCLICSYSTCYLIFLTLKKNLYNIRTNNKNNHNIQIEIGTYNKNCHYQRVYLHSKVMKDEEYFLCPKIIKVFFSNIFQKKMLIS